MHITIFSTILGAAFVQHCCATLVNRQIGNVNIGRVELKKECYDDNGLSFAATIHSGYDEWKNCAGLGSGGEWKSGIYAHRTDPGLCKFGVNIFNANYYNYYFELGTSDTDPAPKVDQYSYRVSDKIDAHTVATAAHINRRFITIGLKTPLIDMYIPFGTPPYYSNDYTTGFRVAFEPMAKNLGLESIYKTTKTSGTGDKQTFAGLYSTTQSLAIDTHCVMAAYALAAKESSTTYTMKQCFKIVPYSPTRKCGITPTCPRCTFFGCAAVPSQYAEAVDSCYRRYQVSNTSPGKDNLVVNILNTAFTTGLGSIPGVGPAVAVLWAAASNAQTFEQFARSVGGLGLSMTFAQAQAFIAKNEPLVTSVAKGFGTGFKV
ncbi:hypothetical protein BGZ68_008096 [Mortierella alpina]|nr:hypothetical protein BGZ68_008096 [Mortierella alpina]